MNNLFMEGYEAFCVGVDPVEATRGFTKESETLWLDGWLSAWEEFDTDFNEEYK